MSNIIEITMERSDLIVGRVYAFRDRVSGIIAGGEVTASQRAAGGQTHYTVDMSAREVDMDTGKRREFELKDPDSHGVPYARRD